MNTNNINNINNRNEYFYVEKNNFISNYLVDKFKLWIWDFDDTLIDTTTYYKNSMETEDIINRTNEELDIEIPNWRYFVSIVNYLVSRGIRVGIASFGTHKIIKAYMDRLFGINQRIFTDVNLKALCRDANGKALKFYPNKNDFIEKIMKCYRIYEPIKVILFDDNMTNIADAMDSGIVGVKILGKDDNELINRKNQYSTNTDTRYFGRYIIDKLEITLKRLEETDKSKRCFPPNNFKNETFSSIGSRKVGTINRKKRLERERFLKLIKDKYDNEQVNNANNHNANNHNANNHNTNNHNANDEHFKNKKSKSNKWKSNKNTEYFNLNNQNNNLNKHIINKQSILIIFIILACLIGLILIRKKKKI